MGKITLSKLEGRYQIHILRAKEAKREESDARKWILAWGKRRRKKSIPSCEQSCDDEPSFNPANYGDQTMATLWIGDTTDQQYNPGNRTNISDQHCLRVQAFFHRREE